jgi:hypothetical protein
LKAGEHPAHLTQISQFVRLTEVEALAPDDQAERLAEFFAETREGSEA